MSMPESPNPPNLAAAAQVLIASRQAVAASLAGAIIASAGRPHSIGEALEVFRDVYWAIYPEPSHGNYQAWAHNKEGRLAEVHK
jgi:hypothetical protein